MAGPPAPFLFRPARLRFPAQHPFFEDGDVHRHLALLQALMPPRQEEEEEEEEEGPPPETKAPAPAEEEEEEGLDAWGGPLGSLAPGSPRHPHPLLQLREVCSCCQRSFPSAHLLDLHLLECHDSLFRIMAQKQNMYRCLVESCPGRFKGPQERKEHLVSVHRYPPDFRFDKPLKCKSSHAKAKVPPPRESSVLMELNAEEPREVPEEEEEAMDLGPMEKNRVGNERQAQMEPTLSCVSREESLKPSNRSRIPATVCFGQGAIRSFRGRRKKP